MDINGVQGAKTVEMGLMMRMGGRIHFIRARSSATTTRFAPPSMKRPTQGRIRFLANIAGIQHIDAVENFPLAKYDLMQRLMLRAPFLLAQLVTPYMKRSGNGAGVIANMASIHAHICTVNKPVYNIVKFGLRALSQSISAEGEGRIRSFTVSTGYVQTPLALGQIPAQAKQRGISQEAVVRDVMMGASRVKEMMTPAQVANLFLFGFSSYGAYLVGGDLLFDGGTVLTY